MGKRTRQCDDELRLHPLLRQLQGGDRRSTGAADDIALRVRAEPELTISLVDGMTCGDPIVQMRAADALEKATRGKPELLAPFRARLLKIAAAAEQQEVRWHVAQLLSRLALTKPQRRRAATILQRYLADNSKIVKTFAMQALADIALRDAELRPAIVAQLVELTRVGSPAMQSRGRKLLARLR